MHLEADEASAAGRGERHHEGHELPAGHGLVNRPCVKNKFGKEVVGEEHCFSHLSALVPSLALWRLLTAETSAASTASASSQGERVHIVEVQASARWFAQSGGICVQSKLNETLEVVHEDGGLGK